MTRKNKSQIKQKGSNKRGKPFRELNDGEAENFIRRFHNQYLKRIKFYGIKDKNLRLFSWVENKKVNIFLIEVYYDSLNDKIMIFLAVPSNKNKIYFKSFIEETTNPEFSKLVNPQKQLDWLIMHDLISQELKSRAILSSVELVPQDLNNFIRSPLDTFAKDWVDNEYETTLKSETTPTPVISFPTSNQRFFIDRYHFNDMLETINQNNEGEQFTDEFNQCLFAYEHEKWFICAAGLGSCIEHLMLIIILNYAQKGYTKMLKGLGKDPTAKDYIFAFRKDPINISTRQERFFNSVFGLRNSIDHHNTGKTQRNMCDLLLDQISDIYNDYYKSSITITPKASQSKKI